MDDRIKAALAELDRNLGPDAYKLATPEDPEEFVQEAYLEYVEELTEEIEELEKLKEVFPEETERKMAAKTATRNFYRKKLEEML